MALPLEMGAWMTIETHPSSTCITVPDLVVVLAVGQTVRHTSGDPPGKRAPRVSPLKAMVIGIDTDRSATYDFRLMNHSDNGLISYFEASLQ